MDPQNIRAAPVPITEEYKFVDWQFTAKQTKSILPSVDPCSLVIDNLKLNNKFIEPQQTDCDFCFYQNNLSELHQWPEMIFAGNKLILKHIPSSATIEFNCIDALKLVDNQNDWVKVSCTKEWAEARKGCEFINNTGKPYDWTYSTNYAGTLSNFKSVNFIFQ